MTSFCLSSYAVPLLVVEPKEEGLSGKAVCRKQDLPDDGSCVELESAQSIFFEPLPFS